MNLPQIWLVILRYFAGVMAWLIIILVNVALLGITLYCFSMAGLLGNSTFAQVRLQNFIDSYIHWVQTTGISSYKKCPYLFTEYELNFRIIW